jgi:hypothetical protein
MADFLSGLPDDAANLGDQGTYAGEPAGRRKMTTRSCFIKAFFGFLTIFFRQGMNTVSICIPTV